MREQAGSRASRWEDLYQAAVLELDPNKMLQRIDEAESAITKYINKLNAGDETSEAERLSNALNVMHDLRKIAGREH